MIRKACLWVLSAFAWATLCAPTTAETWLRAESPHFIVYSARPEASIREYALMLEDFDAVLRRVHGRMADPPGARKLPVYLVGSSAELRQAYPQGGAISGFQAAGEEDIFAVSVRNAAAFMGDTSVGDDVVLHEYVHHFLVQYFPGAYPGWLNEGYAEYFMTTDLRERVVIGNYNPVRASWLVSDDWIPIRTLVTKSVSEISEKEKGPYYAEAWLLTHYLMSDLERRKQLSEYLQKIRSDIEPDAAWKQVFGDYGSYESKLRAYTRSNLKGMIWTRDWKPAEVTVTTLSTGAGEVLLPTLSLNFELKGADRNRTLKTLREVGAKFPTDPAVQRALAQAEAMWGDNAVGAAMLDKLIAADPQDSKAMRQLALYHMTLADTDPAKRLSEMREAGRLLSAAAKVDPDSYQNLYRYAQTRQAEPGYPTENTYNVLLKAVSLAPQVSELRIVTAQAAIMRNDPEMARAMLIPVANSAHPGEAAAKARAMLKGLQPASNGVAP